MVQKIIFELFENKTKIFSINNTIVVDSIQTEVHAPDFFHNLTRKCGSFDRK